MSRPLIVFGVGNWADLVAHCFEAQGGRSIAALTVHERFMPPGWSGARQLVRFEGIERRFEPAAHDIYVALEHSRQNAARADILASARELGYGVASYLSPTASVAGGVTFGEHCFVMDGVVAQFGASFGDDNVIHAAGFFGQGCRVGSHNYIGAGFFADRFARVGSHNVFGSRVELGESVEVKDWTYVKAFERITASLDRPAFVHGSVRAPGYIVDRRAGRG